MDEFTFDQYLGKFDQVVEKLGGIIIKLSNGASVAVIGSGKRIAINSGIHGDERSGPIAILEWLENLDTVENQLVLSPLLNDLGWDKKTRNWGQTDLNTVFNKNGPKFVQELMEIWQEKTPISFLDIHEDDEYEGPYIFKFKSDESGWIEGLAKILPAEIEDWIFEEWSDNSESFVRNLGCNKTTTIESPPIWPLSRRVEWNIKALNWWIKNS